MSELPTWPTGLRGPEALAEPDGLADVVDYAAILDAADAHGIVDVPAEDAQLARAGASNRVREAVVAERLVLLGYLDADSVPPPVTPAAGGTVGAQRGPLLEAIGLFQQEAGLETDQWCGPRTWQVLQQLVTFEVATQVHDHVDNGVPRPALVRAVRLRLWTLGLLSRQPRGEPATQTPSDALAALWLLCRRFHMAPFDAPQPPLPNLIALLFDQDGLLRAVADMAQERRLSGRKRWLFVYRKTSAEQRQQTDPEVEAFLSCLVRVELWLLGFDVDISRARNYPVYRFRGSVNRRNRKVEKALDRFWSQLAEASGMDRRERKRLQRFITPELMRALADPERLETQRQQPLTPVTSGDYSRQVSAQLNTQEAVDRTWALGKRLGMRLWDGLRRVWRWLRRGFRRIISIGHNLARGFFRYALKSFEIARLVVANTAQVIGSYVGGELHSGSDIRILLAGDGDLRVMLPAAVSSADIGLATRQLRRHSAAFRLSARILSELLGVLRAAVTGLFGWARLLWSLVDAYRDIRPLYLEVRRLQAAS